MQAAQKLLAGIGSCFRFGVQRVELAAIEDGDVHVESGGSITRRESGFAIGREARSAYSTDGGKPQIALGGGITLRGIQIELLADDFRAILHGCGD